MAIQVGVQKRKTNEIDLVLTVLCIIAKYDETLTTYEIADVCGCSQTLISETERTALRKIRCWHSELLQDFL